jgi:NAD(P)-dependent dehydrogenase (short-subunit alcohol dehydrogenase family)
MAMSLDGRVALVTGGSRGIGKGCALALAGAGADVVIVNRRDEAAARETAAEIEALGRRCLRFLADVADYDWVKEAVDRTMESWGRIDILVNNAGGSSSGNRLIRTEVGEVRHLVDTHVFGSFHFTQAVLPHMRLGERGDIIFISSAETKMFAAGHVPYAIAKAGMEAMARCLALEERGHGIRVNVIAPGHTDSEMMRKVARRIKGTDDVQALAPEWPFGRVGQPRDIGNLVAFLASVEAEYITGQVIYVDGGGTPLW